MRARISAMESKQGSPFRFKTVPQGAATTVWAGFVASSDAVGGRYCEDCHVCEVNDDTTLARRRTLICHQSRPRQRSVAQE